MSINVRELREWLGKRREELRDKSFEAMNSKEFAGRMVGELYAAQAKVFDEVNDHIAEMITKEK